VAVFQAEWAPVLLKFRWREFSRTARKINRKASQIGTKADKDERWGDGS
jgi:hypothetical protein